MTDIHFDPFILIAGLLGFALHCTLKVRKVIGPLDVWIKSRDTITYFIFSALSCTTALIFLPVFADIMGWTKYLFVYAIIICYGGGHIITQYLDEKQATQIKKAINDNNAGL